jgi:hypothetical protein
METSSAVVTCLPAVDKDRIKKKGLELSIYQISWSDEKYIPQVISSENDITYHFGCDSDDVYNHETEPNSKEVTRKNLKFTAEARFSFGCYIKINENSEEVGGRMTHFNYTGKTVIGLSKY